MLIFRCYIRDRLKLNFRDFSLKRLVLACGLSLCAAAGHSDNDYFSGGIYDKLGFSNDGQTNPRYYWYNNGVEIKREKCQLKYLKLDYPELYKESEGEKNRED